MLVQKESHKLKVNPEVDKDIYSEQLHLMFFLLKTGKNQKRHLGH